MVAFWQRTVKPLVPERTGILTPLFKTISPVPSAVRVRSSLDKDGVVISVETPEKVSVPVVVIAPDEIVPMLLKLPVASILVVLPVLTPVVALNTSPAIVPEAVMSVAPAIDPALVMPLLLRLTAPPNEDVPDVTVKPLAEVILPVPVVAMLPDEEMLPLVTSSPVSLIVSSEMPDD